MLVSIWLMTTTFVTIAYSFITGLSIMGSQLYFPLWFRLLFFTGTTIFCVLLILNLFLYWRPTILRKFELSTHATIIWFSLWISFIAAASLHQFHLFNLSKIVIDIQKRDGEFLSRINTLLNLLGLLAIPIIYFLRNRVNIFIALLALSTALLIPNDNCANPFNSLWLNHGVLSPMMFIPNVAVILFSIPMLKYRSNMISILVILVATACTFLLGLGHITRFLW